MSKVIYSFNINIREIKVRKDIPRSISKFKDKKKYDRKQFKRIDW